jgi:hypothetical protein
MLYYSLNLIMSVISFIILFIGYPILLIKLYITIINYILLLTVEKNPKCKY